MLSTSVADALAYFDDPSAKETEHFIRVFDKFFDCMNVRSMNEWMSKKKPNLKPYNNPDDSRLEVDYYCYSVLHTHYFLVVRKRFSQVHQ